jgi:hypothetical protein
MVAAGIGCAFMPANSVKNPGVIGIPITEPEFWREVNPVSGRRREYSSAMGVPSCGKRHEWNGSASLPFARGEQQRRPRLSPTGSLPRAVITAGSIARLAHTPNGSSV